MSDAAGVKSIEVLRRGLSVMHVIEESSAATLAELHIQTGIPKASLLRILKTLIESGWVIRNDLERRYVPAAAPGNAGLASQWRARLSALAAPVRATLERRVPWPTDLAVRDGSAMLILDAHRPINSLAVNYRVLGFRPAMLVSSLGRCYLAFCPEEERCEILADLSRLKQSLDRTAMRRDTVQRLVLASRARGYATRDPSELGFDSPERFGAISVPIFAGNRLIAALSCSWLPRVTDEASIAAQYLIPLRDAANVIGERALAARAEPPE